MHSEDILFDLRRLAGYIASMPRVLAIDFGTHRIGVALSDPEQIIVSSRETITVTGMKVAIQKLVAYARDNDVAEIVIGYPLRTDGGRGDLCDSVDKLSAAFKKQLAGVKVELIDERFTSRLAARYMHQSLLKVGHNKEKVDSTAAGILLEEYLERKRNA